MTDVQTNGEALKKHSSERINGSSPHPITGWCVCNRQAVAYRYLSFLIEASNVKVPTTGHENPPQPVYTPQQIDGSPRPQLTRIDSRSTLQPRPGFPNPLLRPPQPRPPPPGGTPFVQRPQLPQRPPGPGQHIFQQSQPRPAPPPNGIPINAPRQPLNPAANLGVRPPISFQRPPGPGIRPQGVFQPRSVPAGGPQRPPFNSYQTPRSQILDPSELNISSQNADGVDSAASENKKETEKPALAAMKNRSFSVSGGNVDPKPVISEDRRRSVSAAGGNEEEKRMPINASDITNGKGETFSRPESRTETYMKKIEEHDNDITSKQLPSHTSPISINNSMESLTEKVVSDAPSSSAPTLASQQPVNRSPTPVTAAHPKSPLPQQNSPTYNTEVTEKHKSPIRSRNDCIEENVKIEKTGRKTPDLKIGNLKLKHSKPEGDNDSGVDESTQGNDHLSNGDQSSPKKSTKSLTPRSSTTPTKNKSFSRGAKSPNPKSPETPTGSAPGTAERKKVPMNKVQVGSAPSPNLKVVKSKIGSLENASYRPGGGNIKIESRKVDFSTASSRITAKNEAYIPGGGDKKIQQQKLAWSAKSKIGSLENTTHKAKGGERKIESVKLDFKDKAKPKVGSKDNIKHIPGGGDVKSEPEQDEIKKDIETKKLDIKVQSKIGSLGNIKHKPGGGDKKIFDDKDYIRQVSAHSNASLDGSQKKKARPKKLGSNFPEVNLISPTQQKVRILEEILVHAIPSPDSRPSSRLSRCGSARSKRPATPRPPWRY